MKMLINLSKLRNEKHKLVHAQYIQDYPEGKECWYFKIFD